nr:hypothetical protein [Enterocloster clostridioformis]
MLKQEPAAGEWSRASAFSIKQVLQIQNKEGIRYDDKEIYNQRAGMRLPDECIALRFVNKAYREVITKPETLYWNVFEKNEFQLIHITRPHMEDTLPRMYMDLMAA